MPFGRSGRHNNRSQHNLIDPAAPATGPGASQGTTAGLQAPVQTQGIPSALSNPSASPNNQSAESFDTPPIPPPHAVYVGNPQQQQQQQQHTQHLQQSAHSPLDQQQLSQPLSPQAHTFPTSPQEQQQQQQQHQSFHGTASSPTTFDLRDQRAQLVHNSKPINPFPPRSQSQRYPQINSIQQHSLYSPASTSFDDLSSTLHVGSPIAIHTQSTAAPQHQHQQATSPSAPAPPEGRRSTRKLIKNFIRGGESNPNRGGDLYQHTAHPSYDNSAAGLSRRHSKRISQPPVIRTGVSQISLEHSTSDRSQQGPGPAINPSPLQGDNNQSQFSTLRRVPSDNETSPYGPEEVGTAYSTYDQPYDQSPPDTPHASYGQTLPDQAEHLKTQPRQNLQYQPPPAVNQHAFDGHISTHFPRSSDTVSQVSHESPLTDADQNAAQALKAAQISPSTASITLPSQSQKQALSAQTSPSSQAPPEDSQVPPSQIMAPPPGGNPPPRRSQEAEKSMRGQAESQGPPPGYRHSQTSSLNPLPAAPPGSSGQSPNFRQSAIIQERHLDGAQSTEGRSSPQPPAATDRDASQDPEKALKELVVKYKNVKRLYFDGKNQIDQLNAQVEQLQNAVANQRISQSRTALDDSEYATRFNRLNGAVTNLSFNIRKDWHGVPLWLEPYVSTDGLKTGKQEMTAIGRAVITKWIVDEIFHGSFHPGLEYIMSKQLKAIEHNIRKFSYTLNSQEEYDALTAKVVSWRMSTLEGLQPILNSPESAEHRASFTHNLVHGLTAHLLHHLCDPPPPGVDGSVSMIVELAVGILSNLPLESRDVAVVYPMPMDPVDPRFMDVEKAGLPQLVQQQQRPEEGGDEDTADNAHDEESRNPGDPVPSDNTRVRFAGSAAVEVRGRQILARASVWTL